MFDLFVKVYLNTFIRLESEGINTFVFGLKFIQLSDVPIDDLVQLSFYDWFF